ncbi:MAG TPA: thioredoxin family protein [Chthoniobacterales bacterium]|jgi:thiol-disulfide isomerase/thioredoxin
MTKYSLLIFLLTALASPTLHADSTAEQQLTEAIKASGTSVVHLWAPWCGNCKSELKSGGWTKVVKENPNVKFYFVSVWNGGEDGRATLAGYDLTQQPNITVLADPGPRGAGHITHFLGLPLSWIPTTLIFRGGDLRYALDYGEIRFPILQQLITDSGSDW